MCGACLVRDELNCITLHMTWDMLEAVLITVTFSRLTRKADSSLCRSRSLVLPVSVTYINQTSLISTGEWNTNGMLGSGWSAHAVLGKKWLTAVNWKITCILTLYKKLCAGHRHPELILCSAGVPAHVLSRHIVDLQTVVWVDQISDKCDCKKSLGMWIVIVLCIMIILVSTI